MTAFGLGFGVALIARPAIVATSYATTCAAFTLPITLAKARASAAAELWLRPYF